MRSLVLVTLAVLVAACGPSSETQSPSSSSSSAGSGGAGGGTGGGGGSGGTGGDGGSGGSAPTSDVHFIGRFTNDAEGRRFSWPGSAIITRFSGPRLDVKLEDGGNDFFAVVIDDGTPTVLDLNAGQNTYTLADNLAPGEHTALIEKRTETYVGTTRFMGFDAPGGAIVPSPAPFSRGIELIGDSITCGYGNEGKGPNCSFTPDTENEYMAYGAIAARALNAAHAGISWSGIGMYRDYGGSTENQMPVRFDLTLAQDLASKWDFSWTPDVVVINLGTNDFAKGDPGQPYVDAYIAFAEKVRGHYPNAYILTAVGSMLYGDSRMKAIEYTQSVITARKAAGDEKIGFVDLGVQDGAADGLGCDYHPSIATDEKMAAKLVTGIKQAVGW